MLYRWWLSGVLSSIASAVLNITSIMSLRHLPVQLDTWHSEPRSPRCFSIICSPLVPHPWCMKLFHFTVTLCIHSFVILTCQATRTTNVVYDDDEDDGSTRDIESLTSRRITLSTNMRHNKGYYWIEIALINTKTAISMEITLHHPINRYFVVLLVRPTMMIQNFIYVTPFVTIRTLGDIFKQKKERICAIGW